jgi:hypothetical protein
MPICMSWEKLPRFHFKRPMIHRLLALGLLAGAISLFTYASAQAYVETPGGVGCFNDAMANKAALEYSLTPANGATAQAGSTVSFSGRSAAPVTYAVASSMASLSQPDLDSGPGSAQPPTSAGESPSYTFVSTKASATARTVYWTASFSDAGFADCAGEAPITYTTSARTLTVLPNAAQEGEHREGETSQCVVPALKGDSLRRARRRLAKADCRLGTVSRPRKHDDGSLVVRGQSPHPRSVLAGDARVAVTLGPAARARRGIRRLDPRDQLLRVTRPHLPWDAEEAVHRPQAQ